MSFKLVAFSLFIRQSESDKLVCEIGILLTKLVEIMHEFVDGVFHMHMSNTSPDGIFLIKSSRLLLDSSRSMEFISISAQKLEYYL